MEKESWDGGFRRRLPAYDVGVGGASSPAGHMHQPGKPIGFLAARNTPYAKKVLSKRLLLFTLFGLPLVIIFNLFLICIPILWGVANHTLAVSVMHIYAANITQPSDQGFVLTMEGQVKKAGVFPAQLYFREPVYVTWNTVPTTDQPMRELTLGHFPLERIGVAAGHGRLKQLTRFNITDLAGFTEFTKYMIGTKEFTWRLTCNNVHIEAFNFLPTFKNLKLTKDVIFNGMDNFENVKIIDFKLPGADPQGGITFEALTQLENPSPFGIQLGILNLDLFAYDQLLGPGMSSMLNVTPGVNYVTLRGRLLPQTNNQSALSILGNIFTQYINYEITPTVAVGRNVTLPDGNGASWLAEGIKVLRINVPFQAPEPIHPIKSILIKRFNLTYGPHSNAYGPDASSDALSAELALPFGFPLRVISTTNEITIVDEKNNKPITTVNGVKSPAETDLNVVSTDQTEGTIYLTLNPSSMSLPEQSDEARREFEMFQKEFTFTKEDIKLFNGSSRSLSETPVGTVLLNGIKFSVESGLLGLQGLNQYPTLILGVDVVGGTRANINLNVNTSIYNPSNVNLGVGDTTLLMVYEIVVGSVTIPNMRLNIGNNTLQAMSKFNPNAGPQGLDMLNRYISGLDTHLNISGYEDSTHIASLKPAFSAVRVNTTLPGLKTKLVQSASLKVLESTGITDDVAQTQVSLDNPFTSPISITHIVSNVTSHGLFLASLDTDTQYDASGKGISKSPLMNLHINLFPPDLFALVRRYALNAGESVEQLDGIMKIGGYTYSETTDANTQPTGSSGNQRRYIEDKETGPETLEERERALVKRKQNMYTNFNIANFVDKAFTKAAVDLDIVSTASIGDYETKLSFVQSDVKLETDDSLHLLLPVLAKPIVQKIVDGAVLVVKRVTILNPQQKSFITRLIGSITNSGPFDATISFPDGLQVSWNNKVLGQIKMPDIKLEADEGAQLNLSADFAVADVDALTEFTKFLVTEPSFIWTIQGQNLAISALGITVKGVSISKNVILTGLNGLKNDVKVLDYDLPSNDPAGGIHLMAQSQVVNPAQVGIELSRFGISIWSNGTNLGPAYAQRQFTLAPLSETYLPLEGRLVHQSSDKDLKVLSQIFTDVVHGKEVPVEIHGEYAGPSDVTWLNAGIKALKVSAVLPAKHFNVIKGIDINQMTLMFTKQSAWAPLASTNNTVAPFYLPFGFPIDINRAGGRFIEQYQGADNAALNVPYSPAYTQVQARIMTLQFKNVKFAAFSNGHGKFSQFIADATKQSCVKFVLHGAANAKAETAAGYVTVSDIPFHVSTSLLGLQNLNARPAYVEDLDVAHGYPKYLLVTINAFLYNPSHLTVGTGDVSFNLFFQNHLIGSANINDLVIHPGLNKVPTNVHYSPQGAANTRAGQTMLENYVQGISSTTYIRGSKGTTDIASLKQALSGIELRVTIPPLKKLLITEDQLVIPKDIAQTSIAQAKFQLANPFTASINLLKVKAKASYKGIYLGVIDADLHKNPIRAPGHKTITSRMLPLKMDLEPKHLIRFIEQAASDTGTDLGPLTSEFNKVMAMRSTKTTIQPYPDSNPPNCHSGRQFDVFGAVFSLLKGLKVTLDIQSTVKLDDYQTNLNFKQEPVPTDTDDTALYLIGPVGAPIVQNIVDQAQLTFKAATASRLTNDGFHVALDGSLVNTGPFDAVIEFPEGVSVDWNGKDIAKVYLPPVCAYANEGVPNYKTQGELKITDQSGFTEFTKYILHNKQFKWTIHTNKLRVRALNIVFSDVKISKDVSFDAFNNLPGVAITSFDIPGETSNALKIVTGTTIPSPASLSIDLETANFKIFFMNRYQGPIHASNLFLKGHATTSAQLNGFITHKSGSTDTNVTGELFSGYLQAKNQTLSIQGDSVVTKENGNKPVTWLSNAFKTLTLKVILPGKIYDIVKSVKIIDLFVTMMNQRDTWAPLTGSNLTLATFANPFHFTLKPLKAGFSSVLTYNSKDAAILQVSLTRASAGTSHGPQEIQPLALSFNNRRLQAQDHDAFASMLSAIILTSRVDFIFKGSVNIVAQMVIGDIPINGIPFKNIHSSLAGFDDLTGFLKLKRVYPESSTPQYLDNRLFCTVFNPSNITIKTTGLSLPLFYKGTYFGRALLNDKTLIPGESNIDAIARYQPNIANDTVALEVIQKYLEPVEHQPEEIPYNFSVNIHGISNANPPLSPFASFNPGLERLTVDTSVPGIGTRALELVDGYIDILKLFAGPGFRPFVPLLLHFKDDLPMPLQFYSILDESYIADESHDQLPLIMFDTKNLKDCYIPAAKAPKVDPGRKICGFFSNSLLARGLLNSLEVIGKKIETFNQLVAQIGGKNGFTLPAVKFNEYYVPITIVLSIGDTVLFNITTATELIDHIGDAFKKLNKGQKGQVAQGMKGLDLDQIGKLVENGFKDMVCILEEFLPLDFLDLAGCKKNSTSSSSSSSGSVSKTFIGSQSGSNSGSYPGRSSKAQASPSNAASTAGPSSGAGNNNKNTNANTNRNKNNNDNNSNNSNNNNNDNNSDRAGGSGAQTSSKSHNGGLFGGLFG